MNRIYKIKEIVDDMSNTNFISDDEDLGSDFDDVESHYQDSAMDKVSSGFETIDHILGGGWDTGSLNLFMGETSNGKCFCKNTTIRIKENIGKCKISTIKISDLFSTISKGSNNI
jgi:replicative DNA helicase